MEASARDEIRQLIERMGDQISPKARQMTEEAIVKIKQGVPTKDALGFTPAMMETLYKYGYDQFQAGRYGDALKVFTFLRQIDMADYRYSFAIAACHQYRKEYSEAAANYIICGQLAPFNPIPRFHLYDCLVQLNQPVSAFQAISETIAIAERNPQYNELKEKALLEYKTFKKELKKYLKENFDKESQASPPVNEGEKS